MGDLGQHFQVRGSQGSQGSQILSFKVLKRKIELTEKILTYCDRGRR